VFLKEFAETHRLIELD